MADAHFLWFVTAADGECLRTIHPRRFSTTDAAAIERIVAPYLLDNGEAPAPAAPPPPKPAPMPALATATATMIQGEVAREQGFTGGVCPVCGGFRMVRTGTCVTCQDCSHNAGCG